MQPIQAVVPPAVTLPDPSVLMYPWNVLWVMIACLTLMTFIGTWIITRGWKE